ncbi:MAG: asparagine synthase-related protein [Dehalococcoidales bacterium]
MSICLGSNRYFATLTTDLSVLYKVNEYLYATSKPAFHNNGVSIFFDGVITNTSNTQSSGELIYELYSKNGTAFFNFLEGYYAVIVIDDDLNLIFACRDKDNIEQLYYSINATDSDTFIFSNDPREVVKLIKPEVNEGALSSFFLFGHTCSSETMFKGVHKLRLFETMALTNGKWLFERGCFDDLLKTEVVNDINPNEVKKSVFELMGTQIERISNTGKSINCLMSGGVDSSLIQAILLEYGHGNSFSAGYDYSGNENKYALQVSKVLGTHHQTLTVTGNDLLHTMENGVKSCGMPFVFVGESLQASIFKQLSDTNNSKVIFGGELGDSIMGSGMNVNILKFYSDFSFVPKSIRAYLTNNLLGRVFPDWKNLNDYLDLSTLDKEQIVKLLRLSYRIERISKVLSRFKNDSLFLEHEYILNFDSTRASLENRVSRIQALTGEGMARMLWTQYQVAKNDNLLMVQPFANYKLIKYMFSVPNKVKIKNHIDKYINKKLLSEYLPKHLVYRYKISNKTPFCNYIDKSSVFKKTIDEIKESSYSVYFQNLQVFVDSLIEKSQKDDAFAGDLIHLISFHFWYKHYILEN